MVGLFTAVLAAGLAGRPAMAHAPLYWPGGVEATEVVGGVGLRAFDHRWAAAPFIGLGYAFGCAWEAGGCPPIPCSDGLSLECQAWPFTGDPTSMLAGARVAGPLGARGRASAVVIAAIPVDGLERTPTGARRTAGGKYFVSISRQRGQYSRGTDREWSHGPALGLMGFHSENDAYPMVFVLPAWYVHWRRGAFTLDLTTTLFEVFVYPDEFGRDRDDEWLPMFPSTGIEFVARLVVGRAGSVHLGVEPILTPTAGYDHRFGNWEVGALIAVGPIPSTRQFIVHAGHAF